MVLYSHDDEHLLELQKEVEKFLSAHGDVSLLEQGLKLFDLGSSQWRLEIEFGKLLFEVWNADRSIVRRVEGVVDSSGGRMDLRVWKPKFLEPSTLELRDAECGDRKASTRDLGVVAARRALYRRELAALIKRHYPACRLERVSNRSDRERAFSAWYTRGLACQGTQSWAFLGLGPDEHPAAADAALAYGLIWVDWLRSRSDRVAVPTLKLLLPPDAVALSAHRAVYLDGQRLQVEIFEWRPGEIPRRVDLQDFGNVDTRLSPRHARDQTLAQCEPILRRLLGGEIERFEVVPDASGHGASLRLLGLQVARVDGQFEPRVHFGLEGSFERLEEGREADFHRFLNRAFDLRRAASPDPSHDLYRAQAERWLESLLVRDLTKIDPAFLPDYVYPQIPAFSGPANPAMSRGVIDILGVTRDGSAGRNRLAVVELKLHEEINLPVQGLDYWLRVKWLHERKQFQEFGYFPGLELDQSPPRLYLVSPAFRFHSTTGKIIRYFDPSVEVIQVGLNDGWREGIKVLFRRAVRDRQA